MHEWQEWLEHQWHGNGRFEAALRVIEREMGQSHPDTALVQNNIGVVFMQQALIVLPPMTDSSKMKKELKKKGSISRGAGDAQHCPQDS